MTVATVSAKGSIVVPKKYRQKYNLRKDSKVQFVDYGGALIIVSLSDDPVAVLRGLLADEPSLTADLLAERAVDNLGNLI